MKKICLVLFIIVFLTGCTLNYDIKIYDDESVDEIFSLEINNSLFGNDKNVIKAKIEKDIEDYKKNTLFEDYIFSYKIEDQTTKVFAEKKYINLASFYDSYFIKRIFTNSNFIENNNLMNLNFRNYDDTMFYGYRTESEGEIVLTDEDIQKFTINLYFERKILEHNSVEFNENENKYSWTYNPNQDYSNIEIVYTDEKRYDIIIRNLILKNLGAFIFISIIIIVSTFTIFRIIFKITNNKKI